MRKEIVTEALKKIDEAHSSITCTTSVLDVLKSIEPGSYANTNILAGDVSNTLALVSEKMGGAVGCDRNCIMGNTERIERIKCTPNRMYIAPNRVARVYKWV